jgi:1-acyl-sn-glycerol-3-phosphate acyltransferase
MAMVIWARRIVINKPTSLKEKGPLLLACNHPNSFLDSIILDTLFEEPVWSLARGDVFKKPIYIRLLTSLKILPVYRTSEGVENLSENYKTFGDCIMIFKKNGIVCIFSEGKCVNEWHLRPLKKGTARLAIKAWQEDIPLRVLPVGINYSSFFRFGKNLVINFGSVITRNDINFDDADGLRHQSFNKRLQAELEKLVIEIPREKSKDQMAVRISLAEKILLALPALTGWLSHLPLYLPVRSFTRRSTKDSGHYDSVTLGILIITYPLYLLLVVGLLWIFTKCWLVVFLLVLLPFSAWAFTRLKPQLDKG